MKIHIIKKCCMPQRDRQKIVWQQWEEISGTHWSGNEKNVTWCCHTAARLMLHHVKSWARLRLYADLRPVILFFSSSIRSTFLIDISRLESDLERETPNRPNFSSLAPIKAWNKSPQTRRRFLFISNSCKKTRRRENDRRQTKMCDPCLWCNFLAKILNF